MALPFRQIAIDFHLCIRSVLIFVSSEWLKMKPSGDTTQHKRNMILMKHQLEKSDETIPLTSGQKKCMPYRQKYQQQLRTKSRATVLNLLKDPDLSKYWGNSIIATCHNGMW